MLYFIAYFIAKVNDSDVVERNSDALDKNDYVHERRTQAGACIGSTGSRRRERVQPAEGGLLHRQCHQALGSPRCHSEIGEFDAARVVL